MAIIAKYKFNPSLYADYLPYFNTEFTGYTKTDVTNSDGTITRTISHDTLKPTLMKFGNDGNVTDREKSLLEVIECDTSEVTNMAYMFNSCSSLTSLDLSNFDTSKVTNFDSIFENCTSLATINVSSWDTSKVTNMAYMFNNCNKLTSLDVSNFNTSQVTSMFKMFQSCSSLTSLYVSNFNTSKVTNISNMFMGCKSLTSLDLSNFDTSNVTTMQYMFNNCSSLTLLDLSNFDTSNVTNMAYMLSDCTASDIGLLYATSATINSLVTKLGTSTARNIYYTDAPLNELTVQDNITYKKYEFAKATLPYTLNKLPNGVADYIDVVNKVHVQRVGVIEDASTLSWDMWSDNPNPDGNARFVGSIHINSLPDGATINNATFMSNKLISLTSMSTDLALYSVSNFVFVTFLGLENNTLDGFKAKMTELKPKILYTLSTPIYTPLTEEEIAQLPLSAYADGYVMLSSDQLMPSFEFRMKASNRYQVDMLETGYYYLNAPVGNVKLGTANVDVQQMPCIVKVDNVGTGDSGYRLTTSATGGFNITIPKSDMIDGAYFDDADGRFVQNSNMCYSQIYYEISPNTMYGVNSPANMRIQLYTENQSFIKTISQNGVWASFTTTSDTKYFRFSYNINSKKDYTLIANPITLAKLPSHRIPTSFTQGMRCGTNFGYWEGVKESAWRGIRLTGETGDGSLRSRDNNIRYLNRIEGNYQGNIVVEDEFDFGTGKLIKRVGKVVLDGSVPIYDVRNVGEKYTYIIILGDKMGIKFNNSFGNYGFAMSATVPFGVNYSGEYNHMFTGGNNLMVTIKNSELGIPTKEGIVKYFELNPMTVYYQLAVPEISYVDVLSHYGKTASNKTDLKTNYYIANTYLQPQVKPSHLTYPVPSLVGNRTYTVVHNRKNISGSTKPIELNLGGTVVQLNDASSKTLVKTPSTLAHSNLIFIGGESTVDHIMVLDGDWTNKPIEYFENMKGHDTDAIITIIGDSKIDDVAEQYLW